MRARLLLCALLCAPLLSSSARADDAPPSVDSLVAKLAELRKQRAALDKTEADVRGQLKAELKRIADLVAALEPDAGPGPKPKPVDPPVPADPLRDKVRAGIKSSAGTDAEKRKQCLDLAALYAAAQKMLGETGAFADADALRSRLREAAATMIGPGALLDVRKVVAGELAAVLPSVSDAPLTGAHRVAAAKVFERLAAILESEGK